LIDAQIHCGGDVAGFIPDGLQAPLEIAAATHRG
jgi:hypothetical protein